MTIKRFSMSKLNGVWKNYSLYATEWAIGFISSAV